MLSDNQLYDLFVLAGSPDGKHNSFKSLCVAYKQIYLDRKEGLHKIGNLEMSLQYYEGRIASLEKTVKTLADSNQVYIKEKTNENIRR
tara:strand:+ start:5620 stop:5883 length:264 start_codon:yes stop_codon:yes gene_type:complete